MLLYHNVNAQKIIAGPIIGAVSDSSAKLVFMTDKPIHATIKCISAADTLIQTHRTSTDDVYYVNACQINSKLKSNTNYEIQINITGNDSTYKSSFKTFPSTIETSLFSFTLGSCTEQHYNDSIFFEMKKHQPLFFLQIGDWLYANNFNERKFYYAESIAHQKELYEKRYEMPNLKNMLASTPIDFMFDDEDAVFDDFSKNTYTHVQQVANATQISEISYPDSLRKNVIDGYHTFFPHYNHLPNQAYHSFVCGNAEFFVVDTRSTRDANTASFVKKNKHYAYKVPNQHLLLDSLQWNWLLISLKNSQAQWKFIVSGVTFNKSYKDVFDIALLKPAQNKKLANGMTGLSIAAGLSTMWFAFPETQIALLNFCHDNQIKNVIVLSGDAHTAAIDDGANAGFPELMAGGLAQKNSRLAAIIKNQLHLNLWNQGGQGIGNNNFNDAFGKVDINGNQSVVLSCIDKYGKMICSYEVKDGFIPKKYTLKPMLSINKIRAFKHALRIKLK